MLAAAQRKGDIVYKRDVLPIYAVTPFTMLDFSGKTACIVWFSGCNMRCGYCHNPQIVKSRGRFEQSRVFEFLEARRGLLDGVVLSGGEATLYPGIVDFARRVKDMGFAVKLDTNGTRPDIVQELLSAGLIDYVALDYKAPREKFVAVTQCDDWDAFSTTLSLLMAQDKVRYELRTTVHISLLSEDDINSIITDLDQRSYRGTYYIQNYVNNNRPTLSPLPERNRHLSRMAISQPKGFEVKFRNF